MACFITSDHTCETCVYILPVLESYSICTRSHTNLIKTDLCNYCEHHIINQSYCEKEVNQTKEAS